MRFLAWVDRYQYHILIPLLVLIAALLLAGCGSERDTQTKAVEKLTTVTGPVIIDTPIGQFVAQPIRHELVRSEEAIETQQTRVTMPEIAPLMQAASGGLSMGPLGIVGTLLGAVTTAAAGWTALKRKTTTDDARRRADELERQRNELIDGVERAKGKLEPDAWTTLTDSLEAEQNNDTKLAIANRTE